MSTEFENTILYGNVTRRSVLKTAAGLSTVALGSVYGLESSLAQTASPQKGGHFKIGIGAGATSDSLDPATYVNSFMQTFGHSIHGYLTEIDAAGNLTGELAQSWETSKDALSWTFKLRQGVEFHNGKKLEASDVVASINHHRGEQSKSAAKGIVEGIEEIRIDDPQTVTFKLAQGNADFPYQLEDYHLAIMPAKDGKPDLTGIGAGGYVLENVDYGVKASSKRFANYWKPNAAWFDSFEVMAIRDVTARTNALATGLIHAMDRCDLKTIHLLERNKALEIISATGTQHYTLPMLVDVAPFDKAEVRLALKYAINRKQILETILRGYGQSRE